MENEAANSGFGVKLKGLSSEPVYNELGIIAETYHELQSISALEASRRSYPLPKGSKESTMRAIFQSCEIALLNLESLTVRATSDLLANRLEAATVKAFWMRGFHRLLTRLSLLPPQLYGSNSGNSMGGTISIEDSPALHHYIIAVKSFDRVILEMIDHRLFDVENLIAESSLNSNHYNLIHLTKICNHEATIWEANLTDIDLAVRVPSYDSFVAAPLVRQAVYERTLQGDTYFTQFRGLHQIPETLGEEVNDRLENVIRALRSDRLRDCIDELLTINSLTESIVSCLSAIVDNLSTADYHEIRENLGLTSGSHSVCLRFHLFTHLYEDLCTAMYSCAHRSHGSNGENDEAVFKYIEQSRHHDDRAWFLDTIGVLCLQLRDLISVWRDEHIHLPRNNLGSQFTKSLTGSPDAITAVQQMRDAAEARDPMLALARAKNCAKARRCGELAAYLQSATSLDSKLVSSTGKVTQKRFVQVQERLGFFAGRCPFSPPPRRKAE